MRRGRGVAKQRPAGRIQTDSRPKIEDEDEFEFETITEKHPA